jgi:hypothetical protein
LRSGSTDNGDIAIYLPADLLAGYLILSRCQLAKALSQQGSEEKGKKATDLFIGCLSRQAGTSPLQSGAEFRRHGQNDAGDQTDQSQTRSGGSAWSG